MSQLTYNESFSPAVAGSIIYPFEPRTVLTYANPVDTIEWGKGVVLASTGGGGHIAIPSLIGDTFVGVAIRDTSAMGTRYEANSAVAVLRRGQVAVTVEQAVTPASPVYVRFAPRAQVQTLTFSATTVTGNSIALTVDGVASPPVPFNTTNAQTLTDLAAAIQATAGVATAVSDGVSVITATAVLDGAPVVFSGALVTGGASQPTIAITETVPNALSTARGNFRGDADSSTAFLVTPAKYLMEAGAGDITIVDLNIP
jgi:hypothetical protein